MADKTINVRFKQKYDTEANWTSANPVLLAGEMAISSDKNDAYKVGDGTKKWSELSYAKQVLTKTDVTNALGYTPADQANKFSINGVELSGNKTTEDLKIKAVVHVTGNASDGYTADKTFDEIKALVDDGVEVVALIGINKQEISLCVSTHISLMFRQTSSGTLQTITIIIKNDNTIIYSVSQKTPGSASYGMIQAAPVTEEDTVPVRFNSEDGRAYVKSYDTELDQKADVDHTHSYAGSSSAGGSANSAVKLDTSAGSVTQPVYFSGGKPVACTYTLAKSVPSNAVFTDTNTWIPLKGATTSAAGTAGYAPAPAAGSANRYLRSDGTWSIPPDTNTTYDIGNASVAGITKLYTIMGSNADGTMTQEAITNEIDNLSNLIENHTHNVMGGNGTYTAGKAGFVPAPPAGARDRYLRSDGTWGAYADSQTNGLMSKNSYNKLLTMEQDLNELETFTNLINGRLINVEDGYNNMNIHISDKLEYADFSTFTKNITVTVKNGYGEAGVNIYQSGYAVLGAIGFSTSSTYYSIYKIAKTSTMNIDVGIRRVDGATSNESVVVYLTLLAIKTS